MKIKKLVLIAVLPLFLNGCVELAVQVGTQVAIGMVEGMIAAHERQSRAESAMTPFPYMGEDYDSHNLRVLNRENHALKTGELENTGMYDLVESCKQPASILCDSWTWAFMDQMEDQGMNVELCPAVDQDVQAEWETPRDCYNRRLRDQISSAEAYGDVRAAPYVLAMIGK